MSPAVRAYVVDPLERAGRTFVQQFTVILLAAPAAGLVVQQNWVLAADSAGFAAIVSLITSILTFKVPPLGYVADLALRILKTGLQSFVGTLTAGEILDISHADWRGALGTAVPVMFTAFLTGLAALGVPTTNGASLLPAGTATALDDDLAGVDATDPNDTEGMFEPYDPSQDAEIVEQQPRPAPGPDTI